MRSFADPLGFKYSSLQWIAGSPGTRLSATSGVGPMCWMNRPSFGSGALRLIPNHLARHAHLREKSVVGDVSPASKAAGFTTTAQVIREDTTPDAWERFLSALPDDTR